MDGSDTMLPALLPYDACKYDHIDVNLSDECAEIYLHFVHTVAHIGHIISNLCQALQIVTELKWEQYDC